MNKPTRFWLLLGLLFPMLVADARAQLDDVETVLAGGIEDAHVLLSAYLEPLGSGFGAGLNSGWISSAAPHQPLGFHLRVGASAALVPSSVRTFSIRNSDLTTLRIANPEIDASPTVSGDEDAETYRLETIAREPGTGQPRAEFDMPTGIGYPYVPAPEVQLGVGLLYDTSLLLRLVPMVELEDDFGSVGMWGLGVHHGLNQWIPLGSALPVDLSVQAGFTVFDMTMDLGRLDEDDFGEDISGVVDDDLDQELDWNATAFAFNVLVGKTLPVLSAYAGLGFETSSSSFALKGTYLVDDGEEVEVVEDPIRIDFDGTNNVRALAGIRIRLAVFTINAEYTLARYSSLNLGVGLSFR